MDALRVSTTTGQSTCNLAQTQPRRGKVPLPMQVRSSLGFLAVVVLVAVSACSPDIGAKCSTATDCSQMGDRACDTSLPGGYCTQFNCEPDTCPSESGCVGFLQYISRNAACDDPNDTRRLRTFCMVHCSDNSDCRSGYICGDVNAPDNPWSASLVDHNNRDGRVCIVPESMPYDDTTAAAGYCQWTASDASIELPTSYDASAPDAS